MWPGMWPVLRGLLIALLGAATLGTGICSAIFFPLSVWDVMQHGKGNYREVPLVVSSVGLVVALVCGLALRWLWRRQPAAPQTHQDGTPPPT